MDDPNKVYWAELQNELSEAGLNVVVGFPTGGSWIGKIDDKRFIMSIPPKKRGRRDWMIMSLYGQNEESVIPPLSKLMSYKPFCKYLHRENDQATATYEWDGKDPEETFAKLTKDKDVFDLQRLEDGFVLPETSIDMSSVYQEFTPEGVAKWEEVSKKKPDAEWSYNKIKDILPFVKKVMPRVGKNQSLFGLSIISLEGGYEIQDEEEIVRYGLEPLVKAGILTKGEVEDIVVWYHATKPSWHSSNVEKFEKEFDIDGKGYRLFTDNYRNCRDLNLQVVR